MGHQYFWRGVSLDVETAGQCVIIEHRNSGRPVVIEIYPFEDGFMIEMIRDGKRTSTTCQVDLEPAVKGGQPRLIILGQDGDLVMSMGWDDHRVV